MAKGPHGPKTVMGPPHPASTSAVSMVGKGSRPKHKDSS